MPPQPDAVRSRCRAWFERPREVARWRRRRARGAPYDPGALSGCAQLSKKAMNRGVLFYLFLASIAGIVVVLNVLAQPYDASHPEQVINVAYLFLAGVLLNLADVRLDRGHLTLGGIVIVATAILTNPLDATLVGLSIALGHAPGGVRAILATATIYEAIAVIAAIVASF